MKIWRYIPCFIWCVLFVVTLFTCALLYVEWNIFPLCTIVSTQHISSVHLFFVGCCCCLCCLCCFFNLNIIDILCCLLYCSLHIHIVWDGLLFACELGFFIYIYLYIFLFFCVLLLLGLLYCYIHNFYFFLFFSLLHIVSQGDVSFITSSGRWDSLPLTCYFYLCEVKKLKLKTK